MLISARLKTAQQQYERAVRLFGLAERMHSQIHDVIAGPLRALADAALATVRAALDPAVFAEAFATGQQLSLSEAYATILAPAHVLQGAVRLHGLTSSPTPDTQVRDACAFAIEAKAKVKIAIARSLKLSRNLFIWNLLLV